MAQQKNSTSPRKLHRLHGGLHLPDNKQQSIGSTVEKARLPQQLIIPLSQHIGEPAEALVKVGDPVLKGQMIGKSQGYISAPVHAPTSGVVTAVEAYPVPHPSASRLTASLSKAMVKSAGASCLRRSLTMNHRNPAYCASGYAVPVSSVWGGRPFPPASRPTPALAIQFTPW